MEDIERRQRLTLFRRSTKSVFHRIAGPPRDLQLSVDGF
jgi:hypothetical protein